MNKADSSAGVASVQQASGAAGPGSAAAVKWVAVPRGGHHVPDSGTSESPANSHSWRKGCSSPTLWVNVLCILCSP